jgi:N-acetyl-anhydromuramyl-L-alanine amidase AmpD
MNIIDRRKNILRNPSKKPSKRSLSDIKGIIIHHSLTTSGSADAFADFHVKTNGWSCMGYHYVINRDGNKDGLIEWCADWTDVTPHVGNYNKHYIGICLVGDFRIQKPTQKQMKALYELLEYLMDKLNISVENVLGHQELPSYTWKQCPALNMDELRGHLKYKTYGEVQNNYNNDLKININKTKSDDEKLMFKGIEFKKGQIGVLTILKPINLWKRNGDKLEMVRILQPNEKYRVYGYDEKFGGQYNVGDNYWVTKMDGYVLYETPSKAFLEKAKKMLK